MSWVLKGWVVWGYKEDKIFLAGGNICTQVLSYKCFCVFWKAGKNKCGWNLSVQDNITKGQHSSPYAFAPQL